MFKIKKKQKKESARVKDTQRKRVARSEGKSDFGRIGEKKERSSANELVSNFARLATRHELRSCDAPSTTNEQ